MGSGLSDEWSWGWRHINRQEFIGLSYGMAMRERKNQ